MVDTHTDKKATHAGGKRVGKQNGARYLGSVDVHLVRVTVAAREMNALKLSSVLQQRMAMPLYSFSFPKKFSIRCRHL